MYVNIVHQDETLINNKTYFKFKNLLINKYDQEEPRT